MFPEVEGYTAAIPSKRDLLTFIKAIYAEVSAALLDGDGPLVQLVVRECLKSVDLFLTKVEGLIYSGPDANRVSIEKGVFTKNPQQEHNSNLILLLLSLSEGLDKLLEKFLKVARDVKDHDVDQPAVSSLSLGSTSKGYLQGLGEHAVSNTNSRPSPQLLLEDFVGKAKSKVTELLWVDLMLPLIDSLTGFVKGGLRAIYAEGIQAPVGETALPSRAVQLLVKHLPELCKTVFGCFPVGDIVSQGVDEFAARVKCLYVSTSTLLRPQSSGCRARTRADIHALGAALRTIQQDFKCKVVVADDPVELECR